MLFTAKRLEATTSILPSGNLTSMTGYGKGKIKSFECGDKDHLRLECPILGREPRGGGNIGTQSNGTDREKCQGGSTLLCPTRMIRRLSMEWIGGSVGTARVVRLDRLDSFL